MFCSHLTQAGAPDMRDNAIINSPEIVSKCVTERVLWPEFRLVRWQSWSVGGGDIPAIVTRLTFSNQTKHYTWSCWQIVIFYVGILVGTQPGITVFDVGGICSLLIHL